MFVKVWQLSSLSNILIPQFEGQTKTKLGNSEVVKITNRLFSEAFSDFLLENPAVAKKIIEKGILASKARLQLSAHVKWPARNQD